MNDNISSTPVIAEYIECVTYTVSKAANIADKLYSNGVLAIKIFDSTPALGSLATLVRYYS